MATGELWEDVAGLCRLEPTTPDNAAVGTFAFARPNAASPTPSTVAWPASTDV